MNIVSKNPVLRNTTFLVFLFLVCLALFWKTLHIGFLLDDFYHIDYLHKALNGQWTVFLEKLHGNWSGEADSMTSWRPLLSIALLSVFAIGHQTAFWCHIFNILLLSLCSICIFHLTKVLLRTLQLSNSLENAFQREDSSINSNLTALGATLLFVTYPLHPESAVTATNSGDLLAGLFYLISLLTYFLYRENNRSWLFILSLLSCLCALLTKEIAVTLPAVLSLSAWMGIPPYTESKNALAEKPKTKVWLYWLILLIYGMARTLSLGTIIGGYGGFSLRILSQQLVGFFDLGTIGKIFWPLNAHMVVFDSLFLWLMVLYSLIALRGIIVLVKHQYVRQITLFLLGWIIIGILPTFQIWHIYPNLIGSRLFFISSIPFCILLAILGTSSINPEIPSRGSSIVRWLLRGVPILLICLAWADILNTNFIPYEIANSQLRLAQEDLRILAAKMPQKKIVLLTLPQDYYGAPMLGRAEFLKSFCQPPCMETDISDRIVSIEQPSPGAHALIYARSLEKILQNKNNDLLVLVWSKDWGCFIPWQQAIGKSVDPTLMGSAIWEGNFASPSSEGADHFSWDAKMPGKSRFDNLVSMSVAPDYCDQNLIIFDLQKYPEWTYASEIVDYKLEPTDQKSEKIGKLSLVPANSVKPEAELNYSDSSPLNIQPVLHIASGQSVILSFNVEKMTQAKISQIRGVQIQIPKQGNCFPEIFLSCAGCGKSIKSLSIKKGQIVFTEIELRKYFPHLDNKIAQLRVVAKDQSDKLFGLASEPVSFAYDKP